LTRPADPICRKNVAADARSCPRLPPLNLHGKEEVATDDGAAEATAQRLIRAAGFEPLKVGGVSDAGRIEGPDGELQGRIFGLDEARATIATEGVKA
jgi:hypothetical protein